LGATAWGHTLKDVSHPGNPTIRLERHRYYGSSAFNGGERIVETRRGPRPRPTEVNGFRFAGSSKTKCRRPSAEYQVQKTNNRRVRNHACVSGRHPAPLKKRGGKIPAAPQLLNSLVQAPRAPMPSKKNA